MPCGENSHAAFDYLCHYRSPRMMALDADYSVSRAFRAGSWPTFIVIDQEGVIRFHGFDSDRDLAGVRKCLRDVLKAKSDDPNQVMSQGIALPADVLAARQARRDRSPRLAFDTSGNPLVVFYSNRTGTNGVYLRRCNAQGVPAPDELVSGTGMESYGPACAVDSAGALWIAWCGRSGTNYDVFVQCRRASQEPATEQLTFSYDDAMAPRIAAGQNGALTVTYYKWAKLRGISRDRNIFARRYDPARRAWESELEVSPPEPAVEDHTDPDVVVDSQGTNWVVWSFDYHSSLYKNKKPVEVDQPTIFAAHLAGNNVSAPMLVGATGQFRHAIDLFPSAAVDSQGTLWCAWDCSEPRRCIRLARLNKEDNTFRLASTFEAPDAICTTPELAPADAERLVLAWTQRRRGEPWRGKVILFKQSRAVAETVLSGDKDVLYPQALVSPKGRCWVVYEGTDASGSEVVLRDVSRELGFRAE